MWESLMLAIINSVADEIKPFAFMALAGNIRTDQHTGKIKSNNRQKILKKAVVKAKQSNVMSKCCKIM